MNETIASLKLFEGEHEMDCTGDLSTCPDIDHCQKFEVFVPITIKPFGNVDKDDITVCCDGECCIIPGHQCHEHERKNHEFTVAQKIKVKIPVKFGAKVCVDKSCDENLGSCDDVEPTGITLCHSDLKVNRYSTHQFTATVLPEDAKDKSVTWTSGNDYYVTISANGLATGVRKGTARIYVTTVNNVSAYCTVEVVDREDN